MYFPSSWRILLNNIADGQWHSGQKIADQLGISRAAVNAQFKRLQQLGLPLIASSHKGYRLLYPLDLLSTEKIVSQLSPLASELFLPHLLLHDTISSSNRFLLDNAFNFENAVCLAEYQTHSYGRRHRPWLCAPLSSLCFSILFTLHLVDPTILSSISLFAGLLLAKAFTKLGLKGIGIKWPNDIYFHDAKLAGLLAEWVRHGEGPYKLIIGIGINFAILDTLLEKIARPVTDVSRIAGELVVSRNTLVAEILNLFAEELPIYLVKGLSFYLEEWKNYDILQGRKVVLTMANGAAIHVKIKGITPHGFIEVIHENGEEHVYTSAEISLGPLAFGNEAL